MIQLETERTVAPSSGIYKSYGKRLMDIILSALGLLLLSPVYVVIAIAVRMNMGSPVLFRQPRPGLGEQTFVMLKFRTMADTCDRNGGPLPDTERVTWFGKLLRATSLDELPELWLVLTGKMSLVGPRPLLVEYLPFYSEEERRRHSVRPGITGLAQITGRNETTWGRRLQLDIFYVDHCSVLLDCRIIIQTIVVIFRGDGGIGAVEKLGRFRGTNGL